MRFEKHAFNAWYEKHASLEKPYAYIVQPMHLNNARFGKPMFYKTHV